MTTNQTIDGILVSRELLERLRDGNISIAGPDFWSAWKELRALLDAPAENITDLDAVLWAEVLRAASESAWMPLEYMRNDWVDDVCRFLREGPGAFLDTEPAAQPQGVPIYQVRTYGEGWQDVDKVRFEYCSKYPYYNVRKLYTEQPAPVSPN